MWGCSRTCALRFCGCESLLSIVMTVSQNECDYQWAFFMEVWKNGCTQFALFLPRYLCRVQRYMDQKIPGPLALKI